MTQYIMYFLIVLIATVAGSMTGIGGGIIIKPVLDAMGHYSVATIGILSSVTVLTMAAVSVSRQFAQGARIKPGIACPLIIGSVLGGLIGETSFKAILSVTGAGAAVTAIQNTILALMVITIFIYINVKNRVKSRTSQGFKQAVLTGGFLGIISSFLGIGGGPANVALLMLVFSFEVKSAAVYSLLIILFSQASKLISVAVSTGFGSFTLNMLPAMVIGGSMGGFIGAYLNKRLTERVVSNCFLGIQAVVFGIAVYNIAASLLSLS